MGQFYSSKLREDYFGLTEVVGRLGGEAFEETAERGRIGIAEVVADLLYRQIRTGGKQVLRLRSKVLLNIIAGGDTYHLFDNYREMACRKMRFFCVKSHLVLLVVMRSKKVAELIEKDVMAAERLGVFVQFMAESI